MKLYVVGLGPGGKDQITPRAMEVLAGCDLIVGYTAYLALIREFFPGKACFATPMKQEIDRCKFAIERVLEGRTVAMVCSGDAGVYGMAGLLFELAENYPPIDIEVVAGVTAACSGAAVLGAPLMHDFVVISLSDLLTPWEKIETRLCCAAQGDFVICLYNPSSKKRAGYLRRACDAVGAYQPPDTVCAWVRNIGRTGEEFAVLPLSELRETQVDMFTTVYIGNSQTREINGRMVTPRGYRLP